MKKVEAPRRSLVPISRCVKNLCVLVGGEEWGLSSDWLNIRSYLTFLIFRYLQQLMDLVKVLQEKLIEEKRKMQTLEVKVREEVCQEMAEQLVSIEKAYG